MSTFEPVVSGQPRLEAQNPTLGTDWERKIQKHIQLTILSYRS